jgi:rhodanese-related sulfurtransferase
MNLLRFTPILLTCFLLACEQAATPTGDISPDELEQRIAAGNAPLILDVRTPGEYSEAHIPGAINIPHTELDERMAEIPDARDTEIVVHCFSGRRAEIAKAGLETVGYTNVRHLDGDYEAWKESGRPLQ